MNPKLQEVAASSTNGGVNTNPNSTIDNGGVDLDQLFNFLSGEIPDSIRSESVRSEFSSVRSSTGESSNEKEASILDEIDRQMSDLQNEIDLYSLRSNSIIQEGQRTPENNPREEDEEMTPHNVSFRIHKNNLVQKCLQHDTYHPYMLSFQLYRI